MPGLERFSPQLLSVLRIMSGLLFLEHGTAKLLHIPHVATFDNPLPPMLLAAGIIEMAGGFLVAIGWFTRAAAFICSGEMAVAYFQYHVRMGRSIFPVQNEGDAAVLFCFIFLFLAAAGAGPWSVDAMRKKS
ncbi:MAG TPA: DoxX family protein [Rhizomicrobium sp.]|nr:DoxX family protein [Rhizomicrobium sp.]